MTLRFGAINLTWRIPIELGESRLNHLESKGEWANVV
jgi:hypothetical protein